MSEVCIDSSVFSKVTQASHQVEAAPECISVAIFGQLRGRWDEAECSGASG
jgi:hypothetical protein